MPQDACPACGRTALFRWREATASDPQLAGTSTFALRRCRHCGAAVTVGDAPDRGAMYEGGTYAQATGLARRLIAPVRALAERDRLRFVAGLAPGSRVLEIGAGDGKLVAGMRARGLAATGVDPSPAAAAAAAAAGIPVETAAIEAVDRRPGSLDAVVAWHALEHLDDPFGAVARARRWLVAGGRIVIAVPNLDSVQARVGGDRWFHQDVPRHRTHFTPAGIVALLGRAGFRVASVRHLLIEQNPLGMWQTLLNRVTRERDVAFRLLKRDLGPAPGGSRTRDLVVTALAGPLLAPAAVVAELIAGLAGRGGSIVAEGIAE